MLNKTLLAVLFGIGIASYTAPASADIGLFFNFSQPYYGQSYYGLYPYSSAPYYFYDPYYHPYYDAPYDYGPYYHPPKSYSYRDPIASCAARFHTYNPVTHTYIGKGGLPHRCP
jgi:hypothetical protein